MLARHGIIVNRAQVLELKGSVPSRNFVQLPGAPTKALGLTGRFCYVQIRPSPGKMW